MTKGLNLNECSQDGQMNPFGSTRNVGSQFFVFIWETKESSIFYFQSINKIAVASSEYKKREMRIVATLEPQAQFHISPT